MLIRVNQYNFFNNHERNEQNSLRSHQFGFHFRSENLSNRHFYFPILFFHRIQSWKHLLRFRNFIQESTDDQVRGPIQPNWSEIFNFFFWSWIASVQDFQIWFGPADLVPVRVWAVNPRLHLHVFQRILGNFSNSKISRIVTWHFSTWSSSKRDHPWLGSSPEYGPDFCSMICCSNALEESFFKFR